MTWTAFRRGAMWLTALLILGTTGVIGIRNAIAERTDAITIMQQSVTAGVFLYGVLGVVAAGGLAMRRHWSVRAAMAWLVPITYVPGAAAVAYGNAGIGAALVASVSSSLVGAGVVWMTHAVTRASEVSRSAGRQRG